MKRITRITSIIFLSLLFAVIIWLDVLHHWASNIPKVEFLSAQDMRMIRGDAGCNNHCDQSSQRCATPRSQSCECLVRWRMEFDLTDLTWYRVYYCDCTGPDGSCESAPYNLTCCGENCQECCVEESGMFCCGRKQGCHRRISEACQIKPNLTCEVGLGCEWGNDIPMYTRTECEEV